MTDRDARTVGVDDLLYTGLRRGDAARLGRQHVRDGVITFRTEKTGQRVVIPILPELAEIIAATNTGDRFRGDTDRRTNDEGKLWELFRMAVRLLG